MFLLSVIHLAAFAQNTKTAATIQGKVTDGDNKPIANVTVAEHDADGRTVRAVKTDVEGNYSLKIISLEHKISFSHISFKSQEVSVGGRNTVNLKMEALGRDLGAVIVTAQKRSDNGMIQIPERNLTTAQ